MTSTAFASPAELMESKSIIKTEDVKPGAAQQVYFNQFECE
jgi:hypothetical protein